MRKKRGLSLQQAARRADTSPATLFRYENGWKRFEVYTLNKIASALGYRLDIRFEPLPSSDTPLPTSAAVRALKRLFWDRPLTAGNLRQYPAWVTERVLEFGTLQDVQTLIRFLGRATFLKTVAGIHFKSARTRVFWQTLLQKENIPCTPSPFRREVAHSWPE